MSVAAEAVNLNRRELYRRRDEDPEFAQAWADALEEAADALEDEARRRAVQGWDEPVFYQGHEAGLVRKFSDTLLIFLLKGARPERFRDRQQLEHTGPDGQALATGATVNVYLPDNGRADRHDDGAEQ